VALDRFGLDYDTFESHHLEPYRAWEVGAISLQAYLDASVFYEPRSFTPAAFFSAICAGSKLLPNGAVGILHQLAASNKCLVGALNNEARETNEFRFEHFGLREIFEVSLTSCYLGLRKPDAAFYRRALDILGRPPQRILFIDDRAGNVAAAVALGIQAIHFEGAQSLQKQLQILEVL
jgi:putative hydrolase of the HAD superfamily